MYSQKLGRKLAAAVPPFTAGRSRALQRKCACGQHSIAGSGCTACEKEQRSLQCSARNSESGRSVPPIVHEVLRSPGQPLDVATRAFFEPRFGYDFSRVRVHINERAAESAGAVNALAYTSGRDVVFGAGKYVPETTAGRRLLAHELSHVVQQSSVTGELPFRIGPSDDAYEQAAEQMAELVMETSLDPSGERVAGYARSNNLLRHSSIHLNRAILQRTCSQNANESFYASAANYCRDSPSTGQLHPGQRCYRQVPVRTSYWHCPPGDQVCFDAQGRCHDSWDNASPVESKDPDGTCNLHFICSLVHTTADKVIETWLDQQAAELGRRHMECIDACETVPWYLKGFCLQGCSPMPMPM